MIEEHTTMASETIPSHNVKVSIVGCISHCAGLLQAIAHMGDKLRGCHIVLMDSDEEALELIYTLGSKMFRHAGAELTLERTTNQEEALSDADFVLTTFRAGGLKARYLDERLPLRHGLIGHETLGAGGFFYALRSVPVVTSIAVEMEKVAPHAFLLNYTHPCNIVTEAVARASGIRVIGMCDSPAHEVQEMAQRAGVGAADGERLLHRTIGLNDGHWTTAVWRNGVDVLPQIVARCAEYMSSKPEMSAANYAQIMLATLTAHYGAIPSHSMHYYYFPDRMLELLQNKPTSQAEDIMATQPEIFAHYRKEAQKDVPHLTKLYNSYGNFALNILHAILNNTGEEWILNVPNKGSINFLAEDRVVELPCHVDARGARPFVQGDGGIKIEQRGLICQLAEYEGATAQVALWGTRRDAIKALAANPLVLSYSKAEQIYEDLATAHAQYLPERLLHW